MQTQHLSGAPEASPGRRKLARRVVEALGQWGMEPQVQIKLLRLRSDQEYLLDRYRVELDALPADVDTLVVAIKVLTLNRLVPERLEEGTSVHDWMNRPLLEIGNQPPVRLITASPGRGLDRVAHVVDMLLAASY
jgi:hypothetical protein